MGAWKWKLKMWQWSMQAKGQERAHTQSAEHTDTYFFFNSNKGHSAWVAWYWMTYDHDCLLFKSHRKASLEPSSTIEWIRSYEPLLSTNHVAGMAPVLKELPSSRWYRHATNQTALKIPAQRSALGKEWGLCTSGHSEPDGQRDGGRTEDRPRKRRGLLFSP